MRASIVCGKAATRLIARQLHAAIGVLDILLLRTLESDLSSWGFLYRLDSYPWPNKYGQFHVKLSQTHFQESVPFIYQHTRQSVIMIWSQVFTRPWIQYSGLFIWRVAV